MELSAIQIVTTVVLIVAAGAVALVCDYLRSRSQLPELALELNVATPAAPAIAPSAASAAAARNARTLAAREEKTEAVIPAPASAVHAELPTPPVEIKMHRAERHSTEIVKPALASAAELTSVRGAARPRRRPLPPPDVPLPRLDEMNPRQALSEWLDQRAAKAPVKRAAPARSEEFAVTEAPRPRLAIEEPAPLALMEAQSTCGGPTCGPENSESPAAEAPSCASSLDQPEPACIAAPLATEPALVVSAPVVEEPAHAAAADIREVLRRAIARRSVAAPAVHTVPVAVAAPAAPAPAPPPAPALQLVAAPAAVPAPAKTVRIRVP